MDHRITNRWTGDVIYSRIDCESMRECIEAAVNDCADLSRADLSRANLSRADLSDADLSRANLSRANLSRANLSDANLRDADLIGADLRDANLSRANLSRANLRDADLSGADLRDANLSRANLRDADLSGADLSRANLSRANLRDADLSGADLSRANLAPIRDDVWAVLSASPAEAPALRDAIADGRIDGSTYEGECCCLVGTLAQARHCSYREIPGLPPNANRPAERFFLVIRRGDTPQTSQFSALALRWVDEWLARMRAAFGSPQEEAAETKGA